MTNKTTDKAKNSESIKQQADSTHGITLNTSDKNMLKPDSMTCPMDSEDQGSISKGCNGELILIGGDYVWIEY